MKKHTNIKLKLRLGRQTIRQLTETDHRSIVGGSVVGSSVVYTCTTSDAQTGVSTVDCSG